MSFWTRYTCRHLLQATLSIKVKHLLQGSINFKENGISHILKEKYAMKLYVSHVCLGLNIPLENFSLVWKCRHYRWSASKSDICAALMAIKKWGLISVPQLYCDKGHPFKWSSLRTRDTRTFCWAFGNWALTSCCVTTCFYDLGLMVLGFEHLTFPLRG